MTLSWIVMTIQYEDSADANEQPGQPGLEIAAARPSVTVRYRDHCPTGHVAGTTLLPIG